MDSYEKLGAFYLGRLWDPKTDAVREEALLYDAKDLTTHAVCVGMTGSGKTGLCVTLLEEAAIDGIPAIAIDPKGDLANLALTFPGLTAGEFAPWIDPEEASRKGIALDELATKTAAVWKKGLAEWGQDGSRIRKFRESADLAIYTPGSSAGLPISVLGSFQAPPTALMKDEDAKRERIAAAVSGLLALLGKDADPIQSRDHILLSNILDTSWREGRDLNLEGLIRGIQEPPFDRVGVLDLESFYPAKERFALSLALNNLLASPGFAAWMEGEPLDVSRLLHTPKGQPRLSIISIAHLSDAERMFFVTLLLNEVIGWMRSQPGTGSLRAILYMDEIFGFFPPTANPPSKTPMLTLMKQARAYGLGVVLATQNPVDLDYKGLSNAGTWFLGRLQTERDKARVLEGLEGASTAAGQSFDRQETEATLAGLKGRVFLMNNVHDDRPVLFHTRWAMSYLRGPLTRDQIRALVDPVRERAASAGSAPQEGVKSGAAAADGTTGRTARPVAPPGVEEIFLPARRGAAPGDSLVYRPAVAATARLHYVNAKAKLDAWHDVALMAPLADDVAGDLWDHAESLPPESLDASGSPAGGARFIPPPASVIQAKALSALKKALADHLYRNRSLRLFRCSALKQTSEPEESEGEFRVRLSQAARERRDLEVEKLRKKFAPKIARLEDRMKVAEQRVDREKAQYGQQKMQTAISFGATLLGAMFGRKVASVGSVGRATTAMRGLARSAREKGDVDRARETHEKLGARLAELEEEFSREAARIQEDLDPGALEIEELTVSPRKSDTSVGRLALAWAPWLEGGDGLLKPAYRAGGRVSG